MEDGTVVTFVEASGADAERSLRAAARAIRSSRSGASRPSDRGRADGPTHAHVELLRSAERDDLWLLVVRGSASGVGVPAGARTWRFVAAGPGEGEGEGEDVTS